jgi:hypothetical protein
MSLEENEGWDEYLRSQFPAFLLPESATHRLSAEEASRFLGALSGNPDALGLLRLVSLLAPAISNGDLSGFVGRAVDFVRSLPSTTTIESKVWVGGYRGYLNVRATTALHQQGRSSEFVTRTPRRVFDLPENVVLRAVCSRLHRLLIQLRNAMPASESGWRSGSTHCEGQLLKALNSSALRLVTDRAVSALDVSTAQQARHSIYREAVRWYERVGSALDDDEPATIARVVSEGALIPLTASVRFEIAVAIRLIQSVESRLDSTHSAPWDLERGLISAGRRDVARLHRAGTEIRFYYNQAVLPPGQIDKGTAHYFGRYGRMRPDLTVTVARDDRPLAALVVECKLSDDPGYVVSGFHEAMIYRYEYSDALVGPVKAVLVTSGRVVGLPRPSDDVVAVPWSAWPPIEVLDCIVSMAVD